MNFNCSQSKQKTGQCRYTLVKSTKGLNLLITIHCTNVYTCIYVRVLRCSGMFVILILSLFHHPVTSVYKGMTELSWLTSTAFLLSVIFLNVIQVLEKNYGFNQKEKYIFMYT